MERRQRRGIVYPALFAVIGCAVLIALGVWQLERRAWKESLIAALSERIAAAPQSLPPPARWPSLDSQHDEFRRVTFTAAFQPGQAALVYATTSALRPDVKGYGYWVFAPVRLPGGQTVVVNRGFVSADRKDAASYAPPAGPVTIAGLMRWPEPRGLFTPADDPRGNVWYVRDPAAIAAAKSWGAVAPFHIDMEAPPSPGDLPRVAPIATVRLPNNHLQYALTWFGLAAALAGVFLVWLAGRRR